MFGPGRCGVPQHRCPLLSGARRGEPPALRECWRGQENGIYVDPKTDRDYYDNYLRFAVFDQPAALLASRGHGDWRPEVVHLHDWQAGLVGPYLRLQPGTTRPAIVATIPNMSYHGRWPEGIGPPAVGLPQDLLTPEGGWLEFYGGVSPLKGALATADLVTTVSPTYAGEIQQSSEKGAGLDGLLRSIAGQQRLLGILNGAGSEWLPRSDKLIAARYSSPGGKVPNRIALQQRLGLAQDTSAFVVGVVSRLVEQKGVDLLPEALGPVLHANPSVQVAVLGEGDPRIGAALERFANGFSSRVSVSVRYDEGLAHQIAECAQLPCAQTPGSLSPAARPRRASAGSADR